MKSPIFNGYGTAIKKTWLSLLILCLIFTCPAGDVPETRFEGKRTKLLCKGEILDFKSILKEQLGLHPGMQAEDVFLQCRQGAYGPDDLDLYPGGRAEAERRFQAEFSACRPRPQEPLFEVISPDFMRVNLGAWKARNLPAEWLFNMGAASVLRFEDGESVFHGYLADAAAVLDGEIREGFQRIPSSSRSLQHSRSYLDSEHPSYRLVSTRFLHALPVLLRAAALPGKEAVKIIAIDGRSASGKTTLASHLAAIMGAEVVHMDEFFLPAELRTPERFKEPGGNVHYERFREEVLPNLRNPDGFSYRTFDCSTMGYGAPARVKASGWRIVEGAYSMHPSFGDYADLTVFYTIAPQEQMRRIRLRNGEAKAQVFQQRWIPLEERYIKASDAIRRADLVLGGK